MPKCEKCGVDVADGDLYEDNGLKICEECKIEGIKPPELHAYFSRVQAAKPEKPEPEKG